MRTLLSIVLVASFFAAPAVASAEEIQAGKEYQGPKQLGIARIGVSFKLPAGWTGGLPQGEETFVVGKPGAQGFIFMVAEQATAQQAVAEMSQSMPMAQVMVTPKAKPKVKGNRVTAEYDVTGGQVPMKGDATAVIGKHGWSVMVFAVATTEAMPQFEKAASSIVGSLKLTKPEKPKQPKTSRKGFWANELAGKRIVRFYTGSGYHEKQQILICPDGRFAYRFNSGGFDMQGWSAASQTKNGGQWSVSGSKSSGTLSLQYNDGRTASYNLAIVDGKLMVDGKRWLREGINCP